MGLDAVVHDSELVVLDEDIGGFEVGVGESFLV